MPVRTKVHDDLKTKYAQLVKDHDELNEQLIQSIALHQDVIEERNQVGALLLDSLALLDRITIGKRQNDLIVERNGLVERAKGIDYLPEREEESHAQNDSAVHQASSSEG